MLRFYIWMLICATNCQVHKILLEMNPLCLTYSEILYTDFNLCNKLSGTQWCQPPCIWVFLHRSSGLGRYLLDSVLDKSSLVSSNPAHIIYLTLQGTYLTSAALSHARDNNLPEGQTLGNFNGEFWGMFASTQVWLYKAILHQNLPRHILVSVLHNSSVASISFCTCGLYRYKVSLTIYI